MDEKLSSYLDYLFRNAPKTAEAVDLREELLQNLNDKYRDLIAEGRTPEEAFNIAVSSIGNIDELLMQLNRPQTPPTYTKEEIESDKKRSGILTAIAVAMYILSPMVLIFFEEVKENEYLGLGVFFVLIAIATSILIYNGSTRKVNHSDATVVDDFRKYQYKNSKRGKLEADIKNSVSLSFVVAYFVISFATGAWYITWVIFIIMAVVNSIIHTIFELKE